MPSPHVLISGASIAGPALAHWLAAAGWTTTVVERFDALRDTGQNIDVRGAAREVVRRMGLDDAVRGATTGETGTAFVDERGDVVAAFPAGRSDTDGATAEVSPLSGMGTSLALVGAYVLGGELTARDRPVDVGPGTPRLAFPRTRNPPADEIDLPRYRSVITGPRIEA